MATLGLRFGDQSRYLEEHYKICVQCRNALPEKLEGLDDRTRDQALLMLDLQLQLHDAIRGRRKQDALITKMTLAFGALKNNNESLARELFLFGTHTSPDSTDGKPLKSVPFLLDTE